MTAKVAFRGRTNRWILGEAARLTGSAVDRAAFAPRYCELLGEELARRRPRALPGVRALLETLAARGDAALGLGTGNFRRAAFLKLEACGLGGYFAGGGFGDEHAARAAVLRDGARAIGWREGERLVVIGDTEHDVRAAREVGAAAVAVATGATPLAELAALAPDAALPGLADLEASLAAVLGP